MVGDALSAEIRKGLSFVIYYQFLREATTQHIIFNSSVKLAIIPRNSFSVKGLKIHL
jgi:hypothetical protein